MHEIEIKILDIQREDLEKQIRALGAEKIFDDEIHAFYYDSADHSIQSAGATFRLRREGPKSVLTFKRRVGNVDAKIQEEDEVEVSDFEVMKSVLHSLGFSPWLEMKKHRISYQLSGVHFEFDKYHGEYEFIPELLEIEGPDVKTVLSYAEMLGFSRQDCKPWDALQVADYYSRRT